MKTILIVDDSPVDRHLIQRLLERNRNWRLLAAEDGEVAIKILEKEVVDLVVSDLQMPRLDGLNLVRAVKERWPTLPVVLVTGKGSELAAVTALRAGAANYSPKSQLNKDLVDTLEYVLDISARAHKSIPLASPMQSCCAGFVLSNDCRLIGPLIEHLQSQLPTWSDDSRLQIGMAVVEAVTNAMHHGNLEVQSSLRVGDESDYYGQIRERRDLSPYCDRRVKIQVQADQHEVRIEIHDEGQGFDPRQVADPTAEENLDKLSGRGLLLIHAFMDEVHYNDSGNQIVMIKRRLAK